MHQSNTVTFGKIDPSNNTWTSKATFPGVGRYGVAANVYRYKGYMGLEQAIFIFNDFYEYDPSNNTWTSKANFPGAARMV